MRQGLGHHFFCHVATKYGHACQPILHSSCRLCARHAMLPPHNQIPPPKSSSTKSKAPAQRRLAHPAQVVLLVATSEGLLYEYGLTDLGNPNGPKCALEGEWVLAHERGGAARAGAGAAW